MFTLTADESFCKIEKREFNIKMKIKVSASKENEYFSGFLSFFR